MSRLAIGKILTAQPFMIDNNFKRSVIIICDHHLDDGSVGFILNKRFNMKVNDLINDFPEIDSTVYFGGPVATDTIHYLHNVGDLLEESRKIIDGVWWGGNFEKLKFLIDNELIKPENIKFFVGYSGWSPGQMVEEVKSGSWVIGDGFANYVFKSSSDILWKETLEHKGSNYKIIGQMPESNMYN